MNKINPLFLLSATIVVTFIAFYSYFQAQNKFVTSKQDLESFGVIAKNYASLNSAYQDKKKILKRLETIIKKSNIKNANMTKGEKKITLKIDKANSTQIEKVVNKLLNEKFNIVKIQVNETSLFIEIGVLW